MRPSQTAEVVNHFRRWALTPWPPRLTPSAPLVVIEIPTRRSQPRACAAEC